MRGERIPLWGLRALALLCMLALCYEITQAAGNGLKGSTCYVIPPVSRRAQTSSLVMPSGLVMWNQYNSQAEFDAGIISDKSGNDNTNAQNTVAKRGAFMNPGIQFNGTTTLWDFRTNAVPLAEHTVACWFYKPNPTVTGMRAMIGWQTASTPYDQCWLGDGSSSSSTTAQYNGRWCGVDQWARITLTAYTTNEAHCLVGVFATNAAVIYCDGIQRSATDTACSYIATNRIWGSASIGCFIPGLSYTEATIYEIMVWHRALSSNEQLTVYNLGVLSP